MSKFMGLLKNEYIKQLKKKSTLFIFILTGIVAVGLAGIVKLSLMIDADMDEVKAHFESYDYSEQIESAKEENDEKLLQFYTYLQDNKINYTNWKYPLAEVMFGQSSEPSQPAFFAAVTYDGDINAIYDGFIKNNDWRGYYEFLKTKAGDSDIKWAVDYRLDNDIAPEENYFADDADWRNSQLEAYTTYTIMAESAFSEKQKQDLLDMAITAKYRLEHDVSVNIAGSSLTEMESASTGGMEYETGGIDKQTLWSSFSSSTMCVSFIGMLIIVIAGGIIASEFSNGTIKFLLINPRTRGKILVSKYITVISIGYIMMILCYIISLLSSMAFFGVSDMGAMYVKTAAGVTKAVSGFTYIFEQYMLSSVYVVVMATFAFAISAVVKSSSLAIGLGIFAMSMGENAVTILKMAFGVDAGRYTIFANSNLQTIAMGQTYFPGQTISFAVTVIVIHMVIFLLTAWDGFVRRDI